MVHINIEIIAFCYGGDGVNGGVSEGESSRRKGYEEKVAVYINLLLQD